MTQQPRLVGGRYELGELIGYGGMAEVHRGRDIRLGRDVAIKVLRADLSRDPSFLARFRREAQAAAGLNHPSIVAVYDTGEDHAEDGTSRPYIVMEYVAGRTLRDVLKTEGRLPARRVMEIGADVCGALDFSHRNGIIHRDIKPANVMITQNGAIKVMDFGIARAAGDNAATVTATANVIGTAQYLSPEQARGESVDARSDVYSTGCLLYELATGAPPFQGDSPVAVAYQHVRENAVPPSARNPEVPAAIDSIVMKALAKNPLNRYQSAGEMRTDLQRALANQPVAAEAVMSDAERTQFISRTPVPPVALTRADEEATGPDGNRKNGLIWLAVVLALLLVVGGIVGVVLFTRNGNDGPDKVAVPNVIGKTTAQAISAFNAVNIVSQPGDATSGPCDGGATVQQQQVCKVDPAVGTSIDPSSQRVTYQVYAPAAVQVPDVSDLSWADASKAINAAHLQPVRKNVNDSAPEGTVVKQDPGAWSNVAPNSQVTLSVSTGKVKLPDVHTDHPSLDDARRTLNAAGFTHIGTQNVETQTKSLDGKVADQDPTAGIPYSLDTEITLKVYKYVAASGTVPDVTTGNPSFGDATKTLNGAGFKNVTQDPTPTATDDPTLDGKVVAQNPPAGTANVPFTTQITLIVYKYTPPGTGGSPSGSGTPGSG